MIKSIAAAGFALAIATSAQAMTPAPLAQPDHMITQVRMGCGAGMVMVNGVCQSRAGMRHERRAMRRCARYSRRRLRSVFTGGGLEATSIAFRGEAELIGEWWRTEEPELSLHFRACGGGAGDRREPTHPHPR